MRKKFNWVLLATLVITIFSGTKVFASTDNSTTKETIAIANKEKSTTYHLVNKKMVKKSTVSSVGNKWLNHWHASSVTVNNKTWWKIGKNTYLKANDNVVVIDTKQMEKLGQKVKNYKN